MEEWPTLPDLKLPSDAPPDPEVRAVKFVGVAKNSVPYIDTLLASVKPQKSHQKDRCIRGAVDQRRSCPSKREEES